MDPVPRSQCEWLGICTRLPPGARWWRSPPRAGQPRWQRFGATRARVPGSPGV